MLHRTRYTNKARFLSRLNLVIRNKCLESWYKTELNGIIYYTLKYVN